MKLTVANDGEITAEEALNRLFTQYNGLVDPNTNSVLPAYDWQADARNWPTEMIWQAVSNMIFAVKMFIPWKEIWSGGIWSSETIRRTVQKMREKGMYLPTQGPMKERREKISLKRCPECGSTDLHMATTEIKI